MDEKIKAPKRKNSIKTRQEIIDAAIMLFSTKGYHETNSNEIAKKAGVAVGSFYNHYKDKKEVLLDIVKNHIENAESLFSGTDINNYLLFDDTKDFVYSIIRRVVEIYNKDMKLHVMINGLQASIPEIKEIFDEHEKRIVRKTVALLSYFKDRLKVKNIESASFIVCITIDSVIDAVKNDEGIQNEKEYMQELANMVNKYLFE